MREREDDVVMITRQEPRPLQRQPALGLEIRTLGTGAVAARVVPDTGDVAVRARLDMTAQGGCPALHEGVRGSAHVGRQGMALLIGGKGVLEDGLERDERHRDLRTRGCRLSSGVFSTVSRQPSPRQAVSPTRAIMSWVRKQVQQVDKT